MHAAHGDAIVTRRPRRGDRFLMATRLATGKIAPPPRFAVMRTSLILFATSVATVSCVDDGAEPEPSPSSSPAIALLQARRSTLGLGAGDDFAERSVRADERGGSYVRVAQRYRGLPVVGGGATLHVDAAGNEVGLSDALLRGIAVDTTPVLAPRDALAVLERTARPHAYAAEPRIALAILPERTRVRRSTGLPVVAAAAPAMRDNAADVEKRVTGYRLVYQVETSEAPPKRQLIAYVDARTGELISWRDSASYHENLAHTFFSGDQMVDVTSTSIPNFFELVDHTRSNSWVWDEGIADGDVMTDIDGVWGDGKSFVPGLTSRQTAAVDCMFGMSVTWDMFENVFGWTGMDGNGVEIEMGVHDPDQFDGACFNDFDNNLYFGDSSLPGGQMCTLDVVGHEYGHAVMDKTADVGGGEGESGGLNEGYSDAWGVLSRMYKKLGGFAAQSTTIPNTTFDDADDFWALRIDIGGGRSMFNPGIKYWNSNLDDTEEHSAAGPIDRAFYFLSQGSKPDVTSRTWSHSLPWGMTGLGNTKAGKIWFRTVTHHLQSGDGYFDARDRTITAVRDLFTQFGDEEKAVRNAFAGIDVGDPAANAPADPAMITEVEPNDDHAHAQSVSFSSTNAAVPGLRKIDVFGTGTSNDEYKFTLACGKTFGARLESIGDYDLKVFQERNSTALDSSANGAGEDDTVSLSSSAGCSGSTTFFVRVIFFAGPGGMSSLGAYTLHLDKKD
jgi:Zn-dependent metalloprotease